MKVNKKILLSVGVIGGILFLTQTGYAEELKEALEAYLKDPSWDWLGRKYDKILFEKLTTWEDIKTMPLQAKCMWKIINQPPNIVSYGSLGGLAGLKAEMGAKKFGEMMFKLFKIVARGF